MESYTYDAHGNPLYYYNGSNYSLNWTEGRKLARITTGGKTTDYLYDASGNRIKKINDDDSYIIYVNANGVPLGEKHYSAEDELVKTLRYIYDEKGSVCGYIANSADGGGTYHFIKNLQGDVTHVYRLGDNAIVASYSYDSWGNIISVTGEKAEENPFRYRGYYYDVESGFYATGSRYYDSEIGRFINADDISYLGADGTPLSYNLYAYCYNNPVNYSDDSGYIPEWLGCVISGAAIVGGVALCATGVGGIFGGVLISAGAGSIINGYTNKANRGSFTAGYIGGAIAGGLCGLGAGLGGMAIATASSATNLVCLGYASLGIGSSFSGGFVGNLAGTVTTSWIDSGFKGIDVDWKETVSSSIISGALNVPVGFGSAASSIASQMGRTAVSANSRLAIGVLSGGIASGVEAIYDLAVYLLGLL